MIRFFLTSMLFYSSFILLAQKKEIIYAGTYSVRGSEGIYVYELDRKNLELNLIQTVHTPESPTFLAVHPTRKFLYSVNRGAPDGSKNTGSISAFAIDPLTGKLNLLNEKISHGNGPCHVSIDHTGKQIFISHYTEGTLTAFHLLNDGSVGTLSDSIRFSGNSINKERQDKPHIHSATPSPDNRFLMVTDLGTDRIYSFSINTNGKLTPAQRPYVEVKPGSGPRHFDFHPNGKYAYLSEELTSTVCVFTYNSKTGALEVLDDHIASLPENFSGSNTSADIHVNPAGKFVIMSNRGHQSLAVYSILKDGRLKLRGLQNTMGEKPRNFLIDKKNEFVLVAHQDTDDITVFKWNGQDGMLSLTGSKVKVPSPVCLKMLTLD
jgi:6-phosphogluconolactonase